jgi:hypothetical protein
VKGPALLSLYSFEQYVMSAQYIARRGWRVSATPGAMRYAEVTAQAVLCASNTVCKQYCVHTCAQFAVSYVLQ